jgi:hypothetical protein
MVHGRGARFRRPRRFRFGVDAGRFPSIIISRGAVRGLQSWVAACARGADEHAGSQKRQAEDSGDDPCKSRHAQILTCCVMSSHI